MKLTPVVWVIVILSTLLVVSVAGNFYYKHQLDEVKKFRVTQETATKAPVVKYLPGKERIKVVTNTIEVLGEPTVTVEVVTNEGKPLLLYNGFPISSHTLVNAYNQWATNAPTTNITGDILEVNLDNGLASRDFKFKIQAQDAPWMMLGGNYMFSQTLSAHAYFRIMESPFYVGPVIGYDIPNRKPDLGVGFEAEFRR
jgi:hypothetical protein